jgi:uncharacterized protein involved in outer membrane biogenesis
MKKLVIRLLIALVVVVILAVLAVGLFLDRAIKASVETIGPKLTGVDIKLQSVSLSVLSGSGSIKGLVVSNPEGFKTPSAINVGTASFALKPGSLLSDKVIVKSIKVEGPEITFETDLSANNLSKILANVQVATSGGATEPAKPKEPAQLKEAKAGKKLQVDDLLITGGRIRVSVTTLGGQAATRALPEIHLQNLGKDSDGITPGELAKILLEAIEKGAAQAASDMVADIRKGALYITKDLGKGDTNAAETVTRGIGDLLKTK